MLFRSHGGDGGGRWFLGFVWVGQGGFVAWFLGHNGFVVMVVLVWWCFCRWCCA